MTEMARARRGISLVEVMVVCVIMGILASMSVPRFGLAMEQSRANIAVAKLQTIWTAQRVYWLTNGNTYAPDIATLRALKYVDGAILDQAAYDGLDAGDQKQVSYIFAVSASTGGSGFQATATRVNSPSWTSTLAIDATGVVTGNVQYSGSSKDYMTSGPNGDGTLDQFFQ